MTEFHIQTAERGKNGATEDAYAPIPNAERVGMHSYSWTSPRYDGSAYFRVIEEEHDCGPTLMRHLSGYHESRDKDASEGFLSSLLTSFMAHIIAQRIREGWVILSASGTSAFLSRAKANPREMRYPF